MTEQEIIHLWQQGINKYKLAEIYKRKHNQQIRIIRSTVRHRRDGEYISNNQALYIVERAIYKSIMKEKGRYE